MDALLILHQLLNWYGGVQVRTAQGHDQIVFSRFMNSSAPPCLPEVHTTLQLSVQEPLPSPLLPSSLPSPFQLPGPQTPFCLSPLPLSACRVIACRCCVRESSAGAVWSECVVPSSAERLLTGWMRGSNPVYFNLFRMPELCPGFFLSFTPLLAASIPHSCDAGWTALASQTGTFLSICLFNPLWLRNVNGTAECCD